MTEKNDLMAHRLEKLTKLQELGIDPYPKNFSRSHTCAELLSHFDHLAETETSITVAGRLMSHRIHGKTAFAHLEDMSGRIQLYIRKDKVGEDNYQAFKLTDIGDIIGVRGTVFATKTGEKTVKVEEVTILTKSIRPLPIVKEVVVDGEKKTFDKLQDKEFRYRHRYIDLIVNPEVREVFRKRSLIIKYIRHFLDEKGFMEMETPILQPLYGGGSARPFVTHHEMLDMEQYLRIADELYLKRLIVGGFEKVYEVCKDFRNEGLDRTHNPEFTQVEMYQAYADYNDMMNLLEELVEFLAMQVCGTTEVEYQGETISLKRPWKRASMFDLIQEYTGEDFSQLDENHLRTFAKQRHLEVDDQADKSKILDEIFKEFVEPKLIQPTFVIDYPKEISPLAKSKTDRPDLVERFEPFICGFEVANAFSELNDPVDQRQRLEKQAEAREKGDLEASPVDEDFLMAMEIGMAPTGGMGIGIDRLVMLLTDSYSIKDVILFPQMKPEKASTEEPSTDE